MLVAQLTEIRDELLALADERRRAGQRRRRTTDLRRLAGTLSGIIRGAQIVFERAAATYRASAEAITATREADAAPMSRQFVEAYGLSEANLEAAVGFQDKHEAQMDENLVETDDSGEQDNHEAQIRGASPLRSGRRRFCGAQRHCAATATTTTTDTGRQRQRRRLVGTGPVASAPNGSTSAGGVQPDGSASAGGGQPDGSRSADGLQPDGSMNID